MCPLGPEHPILALFYQLKKPQAPFQSLFCSFCPFPQFFSQHYFDFVTLSCFQHEMLSFSYLNNSDHVLSAFCVLCTALSTLHILFYSMFITIL